MTGGAAPVFPAETPDSVIDCYKTPQIADYRFFADPPALTERAEAKSGVRFCAELACSC